MLLIRRLLIIFHLGFISYFIFFVMDKRRKLINFNITSNNESNQKNYISLISFIVLNSDEK